MRVFGLPTTYLLRVSPSKNRERERAFASLLSLSTFFFDFFSLSLFFYFFLSIECHFIFAVLLSFVVVVCVSMHETKIIQRPNVCNFLLFAHRFVISLNEPEPEPMNTISPRPKQRKRCKHNKLFTNSIKCNSFVFICFRFSLFFPDVIAIVVPWLPYLRRCFAFSLWRLSFVCLFLSYWWFLSSSWEDGELTFVAQ